MKVDAIVMGSHDCFCVSQRINVRRCVVTEKRPSLSISTDIDSSVIERFLKISWQSASERMLNSRISVINSPVFSSSISLPGRRVHEVQSTLLRR